MTDGENELPPGETAFSVGCGGLLVDGAGALELCDGAMVSAGFSLVPELHAVRPPIPITAAAPAARAIRRVRVEAISIPRFLLALERALRNHTSDRFSSWWLEGGDSRRPHGAAAMGCRPAVP